MAVGVRGVIHLLLFTHTVVILNKNLRTYSFQGSYTGQLDSETA